jgi:photosystem II stability/assembly factor-like uncharacterized protein
MAAVALVGTRKGLFLLTGDGDRASWSVEGPLLKGFAVYHAVRDPRDGTLLACTNYFGGATVHRSSDGGETWERAETLGLPEESGLTLNATWHVEPGRDGEPGTLWLGGDPGVLFRSEDGGVNWDVNRALLEHATREEWNPGAGGMCCHSIQLDPSDPQRMVIAISAAGAFRSDDGGESWAPKNQNVAAEFLPDVYPEVGQCVHKLLQHPAQPDRLWQQNHCGTYRSDDLGDTWERLDGNGLPSSFGFALALDPRDPDAAYVIPEEGADNRVTSDGRLGVYRTDDAGSSWRLLADGLPDRAWVGVLREGFAWDGREPNGLYFGTQGGSVFVSPDGGERWIEAARHLPPVLSVETAEVSAPSGDAA